MAQPDLVVLSHLRWGFVFQRPQHLMIRFARDRRVFFVEEPIFDEGPARMVTTEPHPGVTVATPHLPQGAINGQVEGYLRSLLDDLLAKHRVNEPTLWFYTPMALPWAGHVAASAIVYDCMDELSGFLGAPPELLELEKELLSRASIVFTGGQSIWEAKRDRHPSCHAFPSSVDAEHFASARRTSRADPPDQASIPRPRIGFYGVVDERMDTELVAAIADARPDWQIVIVGPVVKIDPKTLPQRRNLHWIGQRSYAELPAYLAGWDVAFMPFAINAATKFISPTKTLEFLAAGKPIVSTPIRDVVRPYGDAGLVRIASTPDEFVRAIEATLAEDPEPVRARGDAFVAQTSWDRTQGRMAELLAGVGRKARPIATTKEAACSTT
jgi:UDP-galactopyranose mutase